MSIPVVKERICWVKVNVAVQKTSANLFQQVEDLQQKMQEVFESIKEKKGSLVALGTRSQGVARGVSDGALRRDQVAHALRIAQTHQALRASLLTEKQELINHLQEELGQVRY